MRVQSVLAMVIGALAGVCAGSAVAAFQEENGPLLELCLWALILFVLLGWFLDYCDSFYDEDDDWWL